MLVVTLTVLRLHILGKFSGMYCNWRGISVDQEVMCEMFA